MAELLISLAILGVIATFTIPKILTSQQNSQKAAVTKEVIAMISGAFTAYQQNNQVTAPFLPSELSPYMNYLSVDTTSQIDHAPGIGSATCNATNFCLTLANGGKLYFSTNNFGGVTAGNFTYFVFDPDGSYSGSTTGSGKGIVIDLHANGRVDTTESRVNGGATYAGGSLQGYSTSPNSLPNWFSW